MHLQKAIQKFFDAQQGLVSNETRRWYESRLRPLGRFGRKQLGGVTADNLRQIWRELVNRKECWADHAFRPSAKGGLSPYTLASYVRCWRAFFAWCVKQEYIDRNPAKRVQMPDMPDRPPKALLPEHLQRLLEIADGNPRDYAIVCFLADTGCRVGGLVGLTLNDLSLRKGRAVVTEKGRGGGKTRTVFMKPRTVNAVRDYLNVRPDVESNRVFIGCRGPLTESGVYGVLKRLAERARVKCLWNPHAFRHGFARGAVENGADLSEVAQLLGHSSVSVTAKSYARWADHELKAKHSKVSWLPDGD